jgi:hypothetical protein
MTDCLGSPASICNHAYHALVIFILMMFSQKKNIYADNQHFKMAELCISWTYSSELFPEA